MTILAFLKRFVPHIYVGDKTETLAVTLNEGGMWQEVPLGRPPSRDGWRIHSILFRDGSTWDAQNGWRGEHCRISETWIIRRDEKAEWWNVTKGWCGR